MAVFDESIKKEKAALRAKMKAQISGAGGFAAPASLKGTPLASMISKSKTVFAFVSMRGEPDTEPVFKFTLESGKTLLLPRISGKSLDFIAFSGDCAELCASRFGTLEPTSGERLFSVAGTSSKENAKESLPFPALILVPGLAFDRKGGRLGRGAGFYDRFLHEFSLQFPRTSYSFLVAGFCFPHQVLGKVPAEETDFKMDCLILPDGSIIEIKRVSAF